MSRRVIPKGLITNQPASDKGAPYYFGVGGLNRSVRNWIKLNATRSMPGNPYIVIVSGADEKLSVVFTLSNTVSGAGYEYSTDGGATFKGFSGGNLNGINYVIISTVSSGSGALVNGTQYNVVIRTTTYDGRFLVSNTVLGTPAQTVFNQTSGTHSLSIPIGVPVQYIVVGGGGGGGGAFDAGGSGGGGGGFAVSGSFVSVGGSYTAIVGAGGAGGIANRTQSPPELSGSNGGDSSLGSIVALGGQGGYRSRAAPGGAQVGGAAGSLTSRARGGNGGGGGKAGGGGGGAGGAGGNGSGNTGGTGGAAVVYGITGIVANASYGAGGTAANNINSNNAGTAGTNGLGSGGGGSSSGSVNNVNGAAGGSGRVIAVW